jgi:hypothetical protein
MKDIDSFDGCAVSDSLLDPIRTSLRVKVRPFAVLDRTFMVFPAG